MDRPKARWGGAVVREIDGDLIIYEQATHRAFHLNEVAAKVWQAADGCSTVDEMAAGQGLDRDAVRLALLEFDRRGLLETPFVVEENGAVLTRRSMLKRAAAVAALPLVAELVVPNAAAAATCLASGGTFDLPGPFANVQACVDALMAQAVTTCCSGALNQSNGFVFGTNPPLCRGICGPVPV